MKLTVNYSNYVWFAVGMRAAVNMKGLVRAEGCRYLRM